MRKFSDLPAAARVIWAKSGELNGHGLLCHMLDVAAVAEAMLNRESRTTWRWLSASLGLPFENLPRWLGVMSGLHDFGKAIPGFQAKWPEGQSADMAAGLVFKPSVAMGVTRHDLASAVFLRTELAKFFPGSEWASAISQALGAHHGYFPSMQEMKDARPLYESAEWGKTRGQLLEVYLNALSPGVSPAHNEVNLPALAWLAGLTSVADWIGSNQEWFSPGERADQLVEHHARAGELAELALDEIGWPSYRSLLQKPASTHELIGRVLGDAQIVPRPLQAAADRLLDRVSGPVLMIVEAPMGEGKTELAFLAHLRLQARNGHRGLYVALPTQATGNAMFDRALTFLRGFAPDLRLDIQLAHGGAMLDERIHRLRGVNHSEGDSIASSAWFSQRKRPLLSPYGVGTIDQALFATLNVKHHFVRLWGLANRVVVLDEVHAYDTYTSGLIEALLRWLKAMNCSVVLMSATLPDKRRASFLRAWDVACDQDAGGDIAYPRLLLASQGQVRGEHVACRDLAPVQVSSLAEDLDAIAAAALEQLAGGGCGVVIVNTVQRAQTLYSMLNGHVSVDTELMLFHARFPADARSEREHSVLARFGRGEQVRRPARALLIATQVVEQSLDIDFDFMISDLAPVDLLLQRAGRLHRHQRVRPEAHREPRLYVAGFQQDRLPELKQTAWGFVYDPYVLYRTWNIAGTETIWNLPGDIDRLVQKVYAQDPFAAEEREEFVKTLDQALGEHLAIVQEQRQHALNVALDAQADAANAYLTKPRANEAGEGLGMPVVTRVGENSLTVVPVLVGDDGWRVLPTDPPFDPTTVPGPALARNLYGRQLRVSRKDLVNALSAQPVTPAFDAHPLLRNLRPLLLKDGVADFARLRVRLDPELGLTYETINKEDA